MSLIAKVRQDLGTDSIGAQIEFLVVLGSAIFVALS
jgi:hypothetical protein